MVKKNNSTPIANPIPKDMANENNTLRRNAVLLSLILAGITGIVSLIAFYASYQESSWQGLAVNSIPLGVAIIALVSAWLSYTIHPTIGIRLLLGSYMSAILAMSILTDGAWWILALNGLAVTIMIVTQTLPRQESIQAIKASLLVALLVGLGAVYWPLERLAVSVQTQTIFLYSTVALPLTYAIFIIQQRANYTLRTKLIIAFVTVNIFSVIAVAFLANNTARVSLTDAANRALFAGASRTADSLDSFIETSLNAMNTETQLPGLVEYLRLPPNKRSGSSEENYVRENLRKLSNKGNVKISSYALLNNQGLNVVDTVSTDIGQDESHRDYFYEAILNSGPYVSPIQFSPITDQPFLYFSAPVLDTNREIIGVLRVRYEAAILQQLITQRNELAGAQSFAILLDENHIRLADGTAPEFNFKSIVPLAPERVVLLQKTGRLPNRPVEELSTDIPEFEQGLAKVGTASPYFMTKLAVNNDLNAVAVTKLKTRPWLMVFSQPQSVFLAPVTQQTQNILLLTAAIAALSLVVAVGVAQLLAAPITHLTTIALQIAKGDLTVQAPVETQDETGQLAEAFNMMTAQFGSLIDTLEIRIQERTKYLKTSAEISRQLTAILDLDELLQYIINRIQTEFNFYYVHIYLVDKETGDLIMAEGSGEVGQKLKARGHRLLSGQGIVGSVVETNEHFLSNNVDETPNFFRNPLLPDTNSELAVPLRKGKQVLGVLDIQSTEYGHFGAEDVALMQSIANQLAVAVDNVRLLADRESTIIKLQELDRLKSEFLTTMSHELRTPLNSILGFSDILLQGIDGELGEYALNDIQLIYNSGQYLLAIINDILDISKIEAGMMEIVPDYLDVNEVIHDVFSTSSLLVKDKPVEVILDLSPDLLPVYADKTRLKQILLNLVGNAVKFTHQGSVTIQVKLNGHEPDKMYFAVIDTGIGIPEDKLLAPFERFKQADMSKTRSHGGTGLGLAICKQLVEMHGGKLGLKSKVDVGSEFFFSIPLTKEVL